MRSSEAYRLTKLTCIAIKATVTRNCLELRGQKTSLGSSVHRDCLASLKQGDLQEQPDPLSALLGLLHFLQTVHPFFPARR